jgi:hypothetical protein
MVGTEPEVKDGDVRIRVCNDPDPENPRQWDNLGTMTCWHSRYVLGDMHSHREPHELWVELLEHVDDAGLKELCGKMVWRSRHVWNDYKEHSSARNIRPNTDEIRDFVLWQFQYSVHDEDMVVLQEIVQRHVLVLPIYMYDHSGLAFSTAPFSCPWDSGQVGWIWVPHAKFEEWWPSVDSAEEKLKQARKNLEGEINTYQQWSNGDVWSFVIEKAEIYTRGEDEDEKRHVEWEFEDSCCGFYGTKEDNGMKDHIPEEHHAKLIEALANPEYG